MESGGTSGISTSSGIYSTSGISSGGSINISRYSNILQTHFIAWLNLESLVKSTINLYI